MPPERIPPVLALLLLAPPVRAAVASWMHPEYRAMRAAQRAERHAARKGGA
jgi:UPF0716 family protein affecting phage T7 exclusion